MAEQLRACGTPDQQGRQVNRPIRSLLQKLLLFAAAILLWHGEAHATHAMGGELTYTCLGNNKYRVTLNFYRDCNGVAAPTNCNNGLQFNVSSSACGANFNQCFPNSPTVEVITPICPSEVDRCASATGTYGVQRYTYTKVVDLSSYAGCGGNDWVFAWSLCCRNNAITSLNNPGNRELYLDAQLNNSAGLCNSSPTFTNSPTAFYCLGEPISYNPGAVDVDGDSLVFSLIPARSAGGANIPYNANYSALQPIRNNGGANSVTLDPQTGTMTVTPSVLQVAVVTYQVKEYRNGVLIGVVTRDVQFVVRACTGNTSPSASGINGTNAYTLSVCAGTPVSFTVNSNDANAGQTVTMSWNSGIPGGTFTTSGFPFPSGTFTWTPTVANIGNNTFTVHVEDNGCPLKASGDYGYSILVTPPATDADAGSDFEVCGSSATMAAVLPYPGVQGTWTVVSGSGTFANNHSRTTTVSGLSPGANVFEWTVNYLSCGTRSDQVTVTSYNPAQPAANAGPDQQFCLPNNTVAMAANAAGAPAVGTWTLVSGSGGITSPNSPSTTITGLGIGVNRFRWTINNGPCGAPSQDEVAITIFDSAQPAANAGQDINICSPASSVTLNGNAATAPATGTWTSVSGGGAITNPSSRNTTVTGLPVGVHVFRWTISNGPCTPGSTFDEVTVTVYSSGSPNANAGPDQSLCTPGNATLAGSVPTFPATGVWTLVSGTGTITSPASPNTTVTGLGIGANVFQWTVNNGPCANGVTSDQMTVTLHDQTVSGSNAGPDQAFCLPTTTATMAASAAPAPAQGTWTRLSGTGVITDPNSPVTTITGLSVGENVFRWAISNGPCPVNPPNDVVSIFIYDSNAPAANAGPDQQLCTPATAAMLAANAPVFPATGQWTLVNGSGNFADPADPATTVSGLGVGVNTFRWTINNGPCSNPITQDEVAITVFNSANPVASAGPDQDLCTPTLTATLAGSSIIAPATGTWTLVSGSGTIVSPSSPTTQITGLAVGDNIFRWAVSNGACANPLTTDDVRIRVFDGANPAANAGPDQELCSDVNSTVLTGSSIILPASGTWTRISGTGNIVTPNSPTTAVNGLGVGVNVFRWTVSNGACAGGNTMDEVSITVYSSTHPAVTVSADQSICVPTSANSVTVTGTTPVAPATGHWTLVSGSGTITSPSDASTTITDMGYGVNVFQWTVMNGPCAFPGNNAQVAISVYNAAMLTADAGTDQGVCTPINSAALAGSALIFPGTGQWTVVSGTGTFADATDPGTLVSGLSMGANVFRWSVENGPCAAPTSSDVTISLFNGNAQQANAGPDQQLCDNAATTSLAANAAVAPATGSWSVQQGTATFTDQNSPTTGVSGLSLGVNILVWSLDNGACGTSSDPVTITVYDDANPVANAGPDQQLCTPATATTLAGSTLIAPATGTWTLVSGTGNIVAPGSPATQVNGLALGNNVFRWTVDNGACATGITFDEVTISVFSGVAQAANAGPDQDVCTPTSSVTLAANVAVSPGQGTWTAAAGITFSDIHAPNATASGFQVGDNVLTWTLYNGSCGSTTDQVRIRVFDASNPVANAGTDQELCTPGDSTSLAGSSLIYPATGTWTLVSGTGTIADAASPTSAVTGLAVGPNVFRWTVGNGPCGAGTTVDEVTIILFDHTVSGSDAGPDQSLCTPNTTATMAASAAPSPAIGTWTPVSGGGTITDVNDPNTTITNLPVGENVFRWSVSNGACPVNPPNDLVSIFVYDAANPLANAGPDQSLCTPNTSTTFAGSNVTFPAQGTWTLVSGGGTIADIHAPGSAVSGLAVGANVFEWSVSNGPCADPLTKDRMTIFVYDQSNADANAGPDQSLCTPNVSATLAGNTPIFPASGTWLLTQGTAVITDPSNPNTTVTGLGVGENIFVWTVDNGPCANGTTSDAVSIFLFDSNNPNASAGADQELCLPNTASVLAGSAVTFPATGTWTVVAGTGVFADLHAPNTAVTGLSVGTNTFRWTVANGLCSSSSDEVAILLFDDANSPADAGEDQEVCTPSSSVTMAGSTLIAPATGTWTLVSGTGTIINPGSPVTDIIDLGVGTSIFAWTVDNGPCVNGITSDTMEVRVFDKDNPTANAGPDQELCTPTTSASLAGSTVIAPALGTWTVVQGSGTFNDEHASITTVNGLSVGVNILRWTVSNGPCESGVSVDELTITLYDGGNLAANAGADQELCSDNASTTMAGSALTFPATGNWELVSGAGVLADATSPTTGVSGLAVGENTFAWTVHNGPCGAATSDTMSIFVFDQANPVANAGNDQQVCTPLTGTVLAGSAVTFPATGTWSLVIGQGTFTDPADPSSAVTNLGVGVNIFAWTVDNGPCGAGTTSDQVSITLFDLNAPPAAAGPDQSFCTPVDNALLAANTPTGAIQGTWSVSQGTGFFNNENDPNTTVTGLSVGENILTWSFDNGVCGFTQDNVSIFIFDQGNAPANAGPDQAYCTPQDSAYMQANTPTFPATGAWSVINGAGLFENANDPLSKVVGMAIGANTFVWTTDNGPCPEAVTSDTITVIIYSDSTAAAYAGEDFEICLPFTSAQLQAAVPQIPATGTWTILSGAGTLEDPTDPHTTVNDLALGITTLVWNLNNGPCPNNGLMSDTLKISVFDPFGPVANAGPDISNCTPGDSTVMAANIPLFPATGTWHLVSGTGVIADTNDHATAITGLSVGANIFTWTIYNGDCGFGPPTSDTVVVYLYDHTAPDADAGEDQDVCSTNTMVALAGNAVVYPAAGTWTSLGSAVVDDATDPLSGVTGLIVGDNLFVWTIDNGPCGISSDTVLLRQFDGDMANPDAGADQELCGPIAFTTMAASTAVYPASGTWSVVSGAGTFTNPDDPASDVSGMDPGVNVYAWTINNGPCGSLVDQVTVTLFDGSLASANAGPDQNFCGPLASTPLAATSVAAPATAAWAIISGAGTLSDPANPAAVLSGLVPGQTVLTWTISNGPCAASPIVDTVLITVYDGAQITADAGPDQQFCEPGTVEADMFANEAVFPAIGTWAITGSGTITDPANRNTTVTDIGFGTTTLTWTIDNGVCGTSFDAMTVSVFDSNVPPAAGGPDQAICQDTTTATMAAVPATSTATGHWELLAGHGDIAQPEHADAEITGLQPGTNIFQWILNNGACGSTSDTVVITLRDCSILVVPDAFSPNGDGVNDTYVIQGLDYYPENSFKVFNRWGSKVYERSPYRNTWDGKNEGKPGMGEDLPESTYYFILDPGNGKEVITGYIYLRR